jgi:hypothetical protein
MMIIVLSRLHRVLGTVNDMRSTRERERDEGKDKGKNSDLRDTSVHEKWARKRSVAKSVGRPTMACQMVTKT